MTTTTRTSQRSTGSVNCGKALRLAQFALTARDETDLDALTGELARVVQETLQPERVSVWLRKK